MGFLKVLSHHFPATAERNHEIATVQVTVQTQAQYQMNAKLLNEKCLEISCDTGQWCIVCICSTDLDCSYIGARTDAIQQTNIYLGIHHQTHMATFNLTCLSRLIATTAILSQNQ